MTHFRNSAIIDKQMFQTEELSLKYRLFENGTDDAHIYSALITMKHGIMEQDFYISDLASKKETALRIFHTMCKNLVLPTETETLFSEGAFEIGTNQG